MSEGDHMTGGEVWVPAGKWKRRRFWRTGVEERPPERPGWYEHNPGKRRPAVTVIGLLWFLVPCLLLGWQYHERFGWREFELPIAQDTQSVSLERLCEPALQHVDELKILIQSTNRGQTRPEGLDEQAALIKASLTELVAVSEQMRVSPELEQKHETARVALLSATRALDSLKLSLDSGNPEEKEAFYELSLEQVEKARAQLAATQDFFFTTSCPASGVRE